MKAISPTFQNRLLTHLQQDNSELLFPHLQPVMLKQHHVLYEVGSDIKHIYFMENGVASVLTNMSNGASIEVGMIGYEGMVGSSYLLGGTVSSQHIVMQLPGKAYRIGVAHCHAAFEEDYTVRKTILRFVESFLNLSAQTAGCNRLHSVEQRCARWLLMSSDRNQADVLPLTQEYLSYMIGVRRSSISETAGQFQHAGLIRYNHGRITILDRKGMHKIACECYHLDRERFTNLMRSGDKSELVR